MVGKPHRITVMRGGAIGDFVVTLPAIDALRASFPRAELRLIGRPEILCLAHPDHILNQDRADLAPLYTTAGPLRSATCHLFADTDFLLAYTADSKGVVASRLGTIVKGELLVHDPRPRPWQRRHITEHLLEPLRRHGIPSPNPVPRIRLRPADRTYAAACCQHHRSDSPLIVLHPGSGGQRKCWPLDHFLELARGLQQRAGQIILLCGPAEETLAPKLQNQTTPPCLTVHPPGLLELAGLLERAYLFIGNDSGPSHMSAALGTCTVALFGPTDPQIWGPRGPDVRIVRAPSGDMQTLSVDSVMQVALECL